MKFNQSRLMRAMLPMPLWEGEGGGSGGASDAGKGGGGGGGAAAAAAAAAAAGGQGGDNQGGGNQQQQDAGAWKPPTDLPEQFKGATADEVLGKTLAAYNGLRTTLANKPGAPDKPEAYTFKPTDDVAKYFGDMDKHPGLAMARTAAHKHGLSQQQFDGFINEVYGGLAKSGGLAAPYDPKAEVSNYAKIGGFDAATVSQHFQENVAFANGLIAQLTDLPPAIAKEAQAEFEALTDTAAGNALLRSLASRLSQSGIRIVGQPGAATGPLSDVELDKMTADPRIDPRNQNHKDADKRYDPELRARYDAGMAERGKKQNR